MEAEPRLSALCPGEGQGEGEGEGESYHSGGVRQRRVSEAKCDL